MDLIMKFILGYRIQMIHRMISVRFQQHKVSGAPVDNHNLDSLG